MPPPTSTNLAQKAYGGGSGDSRDIFAILAEEDIS
jgi:hypothetical protein